MEALMHKNQSNLGYFLSGITMGVVAGIFLAPKSGPETRRDLRRRADASTDYIKRRADELSRNATDVIDRSNRRIQSQMNTIVKSVAAACR
jgi:gas vesicle protein